ncbi:hypothetical protein SAMN05878281_1592 [Salegentibacter salegens]|uniref:Uncharacterized protein n=1 Tax=Salegentibacter salegens TaxID=143223 RepID=A0A1M7KT29_9FLAO|nr:hypothetical protein [Salegentibacter salegens]PRX43796.1 hypothetical protein LY58_02207 [Salegentibacter salegens]SHM68708.1 hypothetical protein SAMN05878281_1592 [Salegentibacter salegens]
MGFTNTDGEKLTTYIPTTHQHNLYMGNGICSRVFTYTKTGNYKVRFTFESHFVGEKTLELLN